MKRWWWGLPSLGVAIWLVFFLALTCSSRRVALISADGDPCWHWRQGNWMLEQRRILRADEFSHTRFGAPLVEMWWLSEIAFAATGNTLGWAGIIALSAGIIATTLWLLYRQMTREGVDAVTAMGLTLVAASVCATHWLARPHLVTHLLTVVFAGELRRFQQGTVSAGRLFAMLVPLTMLWANLHGAFVTAFVLIGVYLAGKRRLVLAGLLGACLLASLLNPNGWHLHEHIINYLSNDTMTGFVQEYAAPSLNAHKGLAVMMMVLVATIVAARPKWTTTEWLLLVVFGLFAFRHARNTATFALITAPILAKSISERWGGKFVDRESGLVWIVVAVVSVLALGPRWLRSELPATQYPVDAVRYVREHPEAVNGEMFNDVTWGGYLVQALPERKVFIDGRIDFYGEQLIEEFNVVDEVRPGWESVLAKYNIGWTILPSHHRLNEFLRTSWHTVYSDKVAVVLSRGQP